MIKLYKSSRIKVEIHPVGHYRIYVHRLANYRHEVNLDVRTDELIVRIVAAIQRLKELDHE